MLQNEYLVAIVAVHTAENEPLEIWGDLFTSFISSRARGHAVLAAHQQRTEAGCH